MRIKKVQDLNFKINTEDQQFIVNKFPNQYDMRNGVSYNIKHTEHFEGGNPYNQEDIFKIIDIMNRTIDIISQSVSADENVIERVHYIVDKDFNHIIVYIELKNDEISNIIIPRFLGNRFSNIEAMRRVSTNLSGQYGVKTRVYI